MLTTDEGEDFIARRSTMKAIFHGIFVLFFLMASVSCYADDGSEFDVRKVRWGMDKDQVIKSELPKKQI